MNKVIILTDSTCDLSAKLVEENNIKIIPLYVSFDEEIYRDGVDIDAAKLYSLIDYKKKISKTSACSIGDFMETFKKYLDEGYDVFYTGLSSKMSSTYNNAMSAKEELNTERIQISDSGNLSTGIGLLVLKACKFAKEGKNVKEIKEEIDALVPKVRSKFVVDSLEYLHKGGRCGAVARFLGAIARIKPVIAVENGEMGVYAYPIGKRKGLKVLLDDIIEHKDNIHKDCVMVTHSFDDEEAVYLENVLTHEIPDAHLEETQAGCVISSHCGRGTIGILYIEK